MGPTYDPYPTIRGLLAPEYRDLSAEQLDELMWRTFGAPADDAENFFKDLARGAGKAFSAVGKHLPAIAQTALPIAGGVVGTVFGGPLGGMVGSQLGQLAGGAVGQIGKPNAGRNIARSALGAAGQLAGGLLGGGGALAGRGGPAAGQLLSLLNRPEITRGLMSMLMGPAGRSSVPIGGMPVPVGAIANLIGSLANQAAEEYRAFEGESEEVPSYLRGADGQPVVDPAVPHERAAALMNLLAHTVPPGCHQVRPSRRHAPVYAGYESDESDADLYDALELADLADDFPDDYSDDWDQP